MCRHEVQKPRLGFGIPESFQGFEVRWFDVHLQRTQGMAWRGARSLGQRCQATAHDLFALSLN
jgi:hypothetical protein